MSDHKRQYGQEIKGHLLTGISWMIPLIVAAGICIALGQVIGGPDVSKQTGSIAWMLNQIGGWGMGLIVPLILNVYQGHSAHFPPAVAVPLVQALRCRWYWRSTTAKPFR